MKFTVKQFRKLQEDLFGNYIGEFELGVDVNEFMQANQPQQNITPMPEMAQQDMPQTESLIPENVTPESMGTMYG